MNPYVVGGFYGIFVGCLFVNLVSDLLYLMLPGGMQHNTSACICTGNHVPGFVCRINGFYMVISIAMRFVDSLGLLCLVVCVPFLVLTLLLVMFKVRETKGVDMGKVTGEE